MYTASGSCEKPLPSTIDPTDFGCALFITTADGVGGILTYDLQNDSTKECDGKLAILFYFPEDSGLVIFAVEVIDINTKCDESLYEKIVQEKQAGFVRAEAKDSLTYSGEGFTIITTMTISKTADLKVQLFSGSSKNQKSQLAH